MIASEYFCKFILSFLTL